MNKLQRNSCTWPQWSRSRVGEMRKVAAASRQGSGPAGEFLRRADAFSLRWAMDQSGSLGKRVSKSWKSRHKSKCQVRDQRSLSSTYKSFRDSDASLLALQTRQSATALDQVEQVNWFPHLTAKSRTLIDLHRRSVHQHADTREPTAARAKSTCQLNQDAPVESIVTKCLKAVTQPHFKFSALNWRECRVGRFYKSPRWDLGDLNHLKSPKNSKKISKIYTSESESSATILNYFSEFY